MSAPPKHAVDEFDHLDHHSNHFVLNGILLFLTLSCFGLFAAGWSMMDRFSGISGPLAVFMYGKVERKALGSARFQGLEPGTELNNMDVIWTPPGHQAILRFYDGTYVKLAEKTLIVLRRPFRRRLGFGENDGVDRSIFVLRGNLGLNFDLKKEIEEIKKIEKEAEAAKGKQKLDKKPSLSKPSKEELQASEKGDRNDPTDKIQPVANAILYYLETKPSVTIGFYWINSLSGTFFVRSTKSGEVRNFALSNANHLDVALKQNDSYEWRLIDAHENPLVGPYFFDTRVVPEGQLDSIIDASLNGKSKRPSIISW